MSQAYIVLIVMAVMIVAMVSDKFDFGFAPVAACTILVLTGTATVQQAYGGFINNNTILTAGYVIISSLFARTRAIHKLQAFLLKIQKGKSGLTLFVVLLLFTVILMTVMEPGPATLLICLVLSTLPAGGGIPSGQMLLPLASMVDISARKIPMGMTMVYVLALNNFITNAGFSHTVSMGTWIIAGAVPLLVAFVYSLIAYRVLPKKELKIDAGQDQKEQEEEATDNLKSWQENLIYISFVVTTIAMFFTNQLGNIVYVIPLVGIGLMYFCNIISFKEIREGMSSPIIYLLGGMFGLADIMAAKGVTKMIGSALQGVLGNNSSIWVITFVFAFAATIMANLTGSNMGTTMILTPIAIAVAVASGLDPRAAGLATVIASNAAIIMPMDTAIGIAVAQGHYKIGRTFVYTIPLTIIYITVVAVMCCVLFPA
ncbi:Anion permease ArsB/NhaD-like [Lactobacillus sp. wkB8]|uniref:SLC13 family permease n=1 Tax=Lactobacillus sp. wkB8 TaxID=1545702 RepID=UPI00050D12A9|nr:SLC13 family permease [Lactobacillus sp. wkB8]AIS08375.1 Anion permease ArsB/NhaD-like [Lactobacillus sp. wkB8]